MKYDCRGCRAHDAEGKELCWWCVRRVGTITRDLQAKGIFPEVLEAAGSLWSFNAAVAGIRNRAVTRTRRRVYRAVYDRLTKLGASRAEVAALLHTNVQTIQTALDEC